MTEKKKGYHSPIKWLVSLLASDKYKPTGRNQRKREQKAFLAQFTRRQYNQMHQAEVRRRNRERGLNRYGSPIDKFGRMAKA